MREGAPHVSSYCNLFVSPQRFPTYPLAWPPERLEARQMQRETSDTASAIGETSERNEVRNSGERSETSSDRSVVDMYVTMLAALHSQTTCAVHEQCDGSCTGQQICYGPLVSSTCDFQMIQSPCPRILEPEAFCRDAKWLSDQDLELFIHAPVNTRASQIRLLRVKDGTFLEDVVECELIDVYLDNKPNYAAVSYVWGPPCFDRAIICNGKRTWITASLESVLKQFRRDTDRDKPHLVWADALCINQGDKLELTEQLTLMRRIYSEAAIVHVHLGDVDVSWYYGLEMLKKLCYIAELEKEPDRPSRIQAEAREHYGLPEPRHAVWSAYMQVFSSPWFTRTWIIQEIALAAKTKVRFGPFEFEWNELAESLLTARNLEVAPDTLYTLPGFLYLINLNKIQAMHRRQKSFVTLLYTLILTREFHASDPRDKINAILPLADRRQIDGLFHFRADYTVPAKTLYHRFAIYLVDTGCAQPMLNLAGLQRRALDLNDVPTWVPDWTAQTRDIGSKHMAMIRPETYYATRTHPPAYRYAGPETLSEPDVLIVKGCCVDTLAAVTHALDVDGTGRFQSRENSAQDFLTWHNAAQVLINAETYRDRSATIYKVRTDAFIRTLLADDLYTGANAIHNLTPITDLAATHSAVMAAFAKIANGAEHYSYPKVTKMDQQATFQMQVQAACRGHRFAITQEGYMGLVPHCARVGDQIALILGAPVPFVLRESGIFEGNEEQRLLQLVGDGYVHGLMYGEGMDMEGYDSRDLYLC